MTAAFFKNIRSRSDIGRSVPETLTFLKFFKLADVQLGVVVVLTRYDVAVAPIVMTLAKPACKLAAHQVQEVL